MWRGALAVLFVLVFAVFCAVTQAQIEQTRLYLPMVSSNTNTSIHPTRQPTATPEPTMISVPTPTATIILSDTMGTEYLWRWHTLAWRHGSASPHITIAAVGDSWISNRFITDPLTAWAEDTYGSAGAGWISASSKMTLPPRGGRVVAGTWQPRDNNDAVPGYGVDLASAHSVEPGASIRWNARMTGGAIHYMRQPDGGVFRWRIDDGHWSAVDTRHDALVLGMVDLPPLPEGVHFVTVEVVAARTAGVHIVGLDTWIDGPGVRLHKLGNAGATAGQYATAEQTTWRAGLTALAPDVVFMLLGTNDRAANVDPAVYREQMRARVLAVRAALPGADIVLLAPAENGLDRMYATQWYNNELRRLAREHRTAYFDGALVIGPYAPGPLYRDPTHLSTVGGQQFADAIVGRMLEE